jgi:hypothetical protein
MIGKWSDRIAAPVAVSINSDVDRSGGPAMLMDGGVGDW